MLARLAAVAAFGLLLAAVVLSPRERVGLSATGYRRLRAGRVGRHGVGGVHASAVVLFTYSDIAGRPVGELGAGAVFHFATQVMLGQSLAVPGLLAAVVAVICRIALRPTGATIALVLALLALVPPVFTGHAAGDGNHQHGGLGDAAARGTGDRVGGRAARAGDGGPLPQGARRGGAAVLAAGRLVSRRWSPSPGLLSALVRVPDPANLLDTRYGQLVVAKTVAARRCWRWSAGPSGGPRCRRCAAATGAGSPSSPGSRWRCSESRSPRPRCSPAPPRRERQRERGGPGHRHARLPDAAAADPGEPAAPMAARPGVHHRRAGRRRGVPGRGVAAAPARRPLAAEPHRCPFLAGCAVLLLATTSGLARYGPVLFSVHMVQHLLLTMIVPMLLVLGGPVTLALRALPRAADPGWPGPREWLRAALHARVTRVLTHPVFALAFYVISMYMMYLTSLYQTALRSHAAHLLMMGHFLLAGYLFFWVVIGVDPSPRRRPAAPLRMVLMLASMAMHAFLGIVIMQSKELLAHDWFTTLPRSWGPDPLSDQYIAGGIAWSFGELPGLLVVAALVVQWIRADEREARRLDRAADRAEAEGRESDELAAYNAMLAELARRDRERMGSGDSR